MASIFTCPVCRGDLRLRAGWKNYRVCARCGARCRVDARTRRRQWLLATLALATLLLALAAQRHGFPWSLLTLVGGSGLFVYLGFMLSRIRWVEMPERSDDE